MIAFDIEEASQASAPIEYGGEVEIERLKIEGVASWQISPADPGKQIATQTSGTVDPIKPSIYADGRGRAVSEPLGQALTSDSGFNKAIIVMIVALFSLGFLAVVVSDVMRGNLTFETYMKVIGASLSFLFGMGAERFRKKKTLKKRARKKKASKT